MTAGAATRSPLLPVMIAIVATAAACWATWALFIADRDGDHTPRGFVSRVAELLRNGEFDEVRDLLDPAFTFDPHGLDRDAALGVARNEHQAGRFFPYVAFVHDIPGGDGETVAIAVLGVLAAGDPARMRNVPLRSVRVEAKLKEAGGGFRVVSARLHQR